MRRTREMNTVVMHGGMYDVVLRCFCFSYSISSCPAQSGGLEAKSATFNTFYHWPFGTSRLFLCYISLERATRTRGSTRADIGRRTASSWEPTLESGRAMGNVEKRPSFIASNAGGYQFSNSMSMKPQRLPLSSLLNQSHLHLPSPQINPEMTDPAYCAYDCT